MTGLLLSLVSKELSKMSTLAVDSNLIAMMEIHCNRYRQMYGHIRTDGLGWHQPIPFPHRQMPSHFMAQIPVDKNIKIWLQMEKTLFDHYEIPLNIPTYMGVMPARQMGKGAPRNQLLGLLSGIHRPLPKERLGPNGIVKRNIDDIPIRADLSINWGMLEGGRRMGRSFGGHQDIGIVGLPGPGFSRLYELLEKNAFNGDFHKTHSRYMPQKIWDEDIAEEVQHSTDYKRKKGWKRIPLKIPNPAKPTHALLALLKRSE
jgi:hypothetical protein